MPLGYSMLEWRNVSGVATDTEVWRNPATNTVARTTVHTVKPGVAAMSTPSASHIGETVTLARSKLFAKASSDGGLAQMFAERKQTVDLVRNTAARLVTALRALKHGRLGDFVTALSFPGNQIPGAKQWERTIRTPASKRIASHWLEYSYGWIPLLIDVHDTAELLSQHIAGDNEVIRLSAKGEKETSKLVQVNNGGMYTNAVTNVSSKCRITVTAWVTDEDKLLLSQTGISNPALLAWELLPYSFVVDWFVPVGNYLQALGAFAGLTFRHGYQTQLTKLLYTETRGGSRRDFESGFYVDKTQSFSGVRKEVLMDRYVLTGFPSPDFPKPKGLSEALSIPHTLSALALLRTNLR